MPVDRLRQRWKSVVARSGDEKTRRVARVCCWDNIAADLSRYARPDRLEMLVELFDDRPFAVGVEHRLERDGPLACATWLEEALGLRL